MWISRHSPTPRQLAALNQLFGEHTLSVDSRSFDTADDIIRRTSEADEVVVVAPLHVIRQLVKRGLHPLYAKMEPCGPSHPDAEVHTNRRYYRFIRFYRILALDFQLEEITPSQHKLN